VGYFQGWRGEFSRIGVARAEIIEEEVLYRALAERTIAGAVLDVWTILTGGL
jgi:lactate dehydrogenase-like 2-hydroxyacid dehydrogenase